MSDGLGYGGNTKAALMRIGFSEMRAFVRLFAPRCNEEVFFESCGVADLVTTCYGGRNRRVAAQYAREGGARRWEEVEKEAIGDQMLQGPGTLRDVVAVLRQRELLADFPLFARLHRIVFEGASPVTITDL